ncbi:MAG TPA: hypothetical protein VGB37_17160 [Candidatus Lokiarchaeia archaeon]
MKKYIYCLNCEYYNERYYVDGKIIDLYAIKEEDCLKDNHSIFKIVGKNHQKYIKNCPLEKNKKE